MKKLLIALFSLSLVLAFYGLAMAEPNGSPEPGACNNLPTTWSPNDPAIRGTYTVAHDKDFVAQNGGAESNYVGNGYQIHVVLSKGASVQLFSSPWNFFAADQLILCDPVKNSPEVLMAAMRNIPCNLYVDEAFGYTGFTDKNGHPWVYKPIITDLTIDEQSFCGTLKEMIAGRITIRMVPVPF